MGSAVCMAATALERQLVHDVQTLGDMVADDSFYEELYRSLAGVAWVRDGQRLALSYKRAEELVNTVRDKQGKAPLALAQTGGEGEVDDRVADALGQLDWAPRPLNTGDHDASHVSSRPDAPPRGASEPQEWERQAHAEADRNRN
jgi:hypothetical protein